MKISANINNSEYDFDLQQTGDNNWQGIIDGFDFLGDLITFKYKDGVISDLLLSDVITTDRGIVFERLIGAFKEFTDSHQMGFDVEEVEHRTTYPMKPYDPEDIRVRPVFFSAFQVHRYISQNRIDLNPDFQRNFVWNDSQKSLLIESMLLKIPLPAFYFAEDRHGRFQVVDGLQRLTVINQFLNNDFKLKKLQYLKHLEGKYFSVDIDKGITTEMALTEPYDSRVESTQLNINVIEASSPLRVKYDIFYRINTGGRPLNGQEIRNCFATEKTRRLMKEMANSEIFQIATAYSVKDTRMDAQELALRFCGFHLFRNTYQGDMSSFLDDVLEKLNEFSNASLNEIKSKFYGSLESALHLFGEYAFRKIYTGYLEPGTRRQFLNKSIFIAWTVILAQIDQKQILSTPKHQFLDVLVAEFDNNIELNLALSTSTTDRSKIELVITTFALLLNNYLINGSKNNNR